MNRDLIMNGVTVKKNRRQYNRKWHVRRENEKSSILKLLTYNEIDHIVLIIRRLQSLGNVLLDHE